MILHVAILTQCQDVTDWWTDRQRDAQTMTNTRKALHTVARKKNYANKNFELMLTSRANARSSSCRQTVYFQPFHRSSFLECALQSKIAKINKTPYFGSSGSCKVIDVDTTEKLISGAWCDRQHPHVYLQLFSWKTNNVFHGSTALWCLCAQVSLNLENRDLDWRNFLSSFSVSISSVFGAFRS